MSAITITPDLAPAIEAAHARAVASGITATLYLHPQPMPGYRFTLWLVESRTRAGKNHTVCLREYDAGRWEAQCSCEAGQYGGICTHAALVLNEWPALIGMAPA